MVTASVTYLRSLENNVSRTARLLELLVRVPRMFQAASEDLTSWENLHGEYWVIDPNNGCIWERGTIQDLAPDDPVSQDVVLTLMLWSGHTSCFWLYGNGVRRNSALGFRRIYFWALRCIRVRGRAEAVTTRPSAMTAYHSSCALRVSLP